MKFSEGQVLVNGNIEKVIKEVRKTGYTWFYPEFPDKTFLSENSNDPYFELNWKIKR